VFGNFKAFFANLARLTANVGAMADTFADANTLLRERLALDDERPALPETTPEQPADARNGRKAKSNA
jgi:hypothetical protein